MQFVFITLIFITLIVVSGFVIILRAFLLHIKQLETLIKAKDLFEAKHFESKTYEDTQPVDEPTSLTEIFNDKSPEETRASFNP